MTPKEIRLEYYRKGILLGVSKSIIDKEIRATLRQRSAAIKRLNTKKMVLRVARAKARRKAAGRTSIASVEGRRGDQTATLHRLKTRNQRRPGRR